MIMEKKETPRSLLRHLGSMLRKRHEGVVEEPPPERWVELILHLDEKERQSGKGPATRKKEDPA